MSLELQINSKLKRFLTVHKPLKIIIGGRGSGKSIGVADCMTIYMGERGYSIMCLREYLDSVEDSVHQEISDSIIDRGNLPGWTITKRRIKAPNGARTTYKGAKTNPNSLKSVKGYKISWFEEAQTASQDSLDKLIPTIIRTPGAECWFTANPESSADPFSKKFIIPYIRDLERNGYYEDDMMMIVVMNWRDNPWWTEEQEKLRQHDFETMPRAKYDHIWEGKFSDSVENAIIKPEWFDAAKDAHLRPDLVEIFKPMGAVIASHDPFDDGGDAAATCVRHGSIIQQVRIKESGEIDDCCDWATDIATQANADWFVWDGDGMGTGLKRQVSDAFAGRHTNFHMFRGSLSGKGQDNAENVYEPVEGDGLDGRKKKKYRDVFLNNRSQYYFAMAWRFKRTYDCVVRGKYVDPAEMISLNTAGIDDIVSLRSQVCRIPQKPNGRGILQILSKKEMAALKIPSPNESDSIMMSFFDPPTIVDDMDDFDFDDWS